MIRQMAIALLALVPALAFAIDYIPLSRAIALSPADCADPSNIIAEAADAPANITHMRVQHVGDPGTAELAGEISNPVTWNVGELTGFDARGIPGAQRGYRDEGLPAGTSAFQLHCDHAGFLINTWQFSHASPLFGEGPSVSIGRNLVPPVHAFTDGASIIIEADIKVPWILNARPPFVNGTAQVSLFYYLRDSRSGESIAQLAGIFDNRAPGVGGSAVETLDSDGVVNFASSPLAPFDAAGRQVRFVTVTPDEPQMQFQQSWSEPRHYRMKVSYDNFAAVLAGLRGRQPELSADPSDYGITFFGVLAEVFPGTGDADNVSLAGSVASLALRKVPAITPFLELRDISPIRESPGTKARDRLLR
jgi:hypothetical protein